MDAVAPHPGWHEAQNKRHQLHHVGEQGSKKVVKMAIGTAIVNYSRGNDSTIQVDFWSRYGQLLYRSEPGAAAWDLSHK